MSVTSPDYHSKSESFKSTIDDLKTNTAKNNIRLTDEDICSVLNISKTTYDTCYEQDSAPEEVFTRLREIYGEFIPVTYIKFVFYEEIPDPMMDEENMPGPVMDGEEDIE